MFKEHTKYRRINSLASLDIYITKIHGAFDLYGNIITASVVYVDKVSSAVVKKDGLPVVDVLELKIPEWEEIE